MIKIQVIITFKKNFTLKFKNLFNRTKKLLSVDLKILLV